MEAVGASAGSPARDHTVTRSRLDLEAVDIPRVSENEVYAGAALTRGGAADLVLQQQHAASLLSHEGPP
jgi:hypothetical protein